MYVAKVGSVQLVKHLLSTGVSPNVPDVLGRRPLHLCAQATREPPSTDAHIHTFMTKTKAFSSSVVVEMIELLISGGADINATTISGRTPLHELFVMGMDEVGGIEGSSVRVDKSFQHDQALALRCMLQWYVNSSFPTYNYI